MRFKEFLLERNDEEMLKLWTLDDRGFDKSGKKYVLYHGTSREHYNEILKTGLKTPNHLLDDPRWFMLTTDKKVAEKFGKGIATQIITVILKVTILRNKITELLWNGQDVPGFKDKQHAIRKMIPMKYIKGEKEIKGKI